MTEAQITALLQNYRCQPLSHTLGELNAIARVELHAASVIVTLHFGFPMQQYLAGWQADIQAWLQQQTGIAATVTCQQTIKAHSVQGSLTPLPGVKNIIAIASGKGGVGKSTVTANLALALTSQGARVGVLDADIYGPSIPQMLGATERPSSPDGKLLIPVMCHGVQTMSIGFLMDDTETPMIWRGPMVTGALQQLLADTQWDNLDYLLIDLPPGTGDIQLTLAQRVPVSGAIIVTTPQDIALLDARKAYNMFQKVHINVLGVIENMSIHVCTSCGHAEHIFGQDGGKDMAQHYQIDFLGSLPLAKSIREYADAGQPSVVAEPDSEIAANYIALATQAAANLSLQARNYAAKFPKIVITQDA